MTAGPMRWTSASLSPPDKGLCAFIVLHTRYCVFPCLRRWDSWQYLSGKEETRGRHLQWATEQLEKHCSGLCLCITTINMLHISKRCTWKQQLDIANLICFKPISELETRRVKYSKRSQRELIIYNRCFPWVLLLLRGLVGTWGNSAGSLTPAELDESAEITALQGMLATCTTAGHTSQAIFNKAMQEREWELERYMHPEEKQMVVIQAWLRNQCKTKQVETKKKIQKHFMWSSAAF